MRSAFAATFSRAFGGVHRLPSTYVAPCVAQEMLAAGAEWARDPLGRLHIGGRVLVGLAGTPYAFKSEASAAMWCNVGREVIETERIRVAALEPAQRAAWIARKRVRLVERAAVALRHAVNQADGEKRAALLEEAGWCEGKWT